MKKLIVGTAALLISLPTFAGGVFDIDPVEDWTYTIGYNVFTSHTSSDGFTDEDTGEFRNWNENNNIIMFRVNVNENLAFGVGKGVNSYYNDTNLGGIELSTDDLGDKGNFELGVDLILATGYEYILDNGTIPAANPFFRYNEKLTDCLTISGKVGNINLMAINAFVELTFDF